MGIVKRAGDLVYTFRFLRLLTTDFEDTEAYKLGLIDEKGKRLKKPESAEEKDVYTPFHKLVFNIKKLIPGGKFGSYASALYLLKNNYNISDTKINHGLELLDIDTTDILSESSQWLILEDGRLSPGSYRVKGAKLLNDTLDDMVNEKDWIRIEQNAYPVGEIFGLNVYEAIHRRTNKKVFVTVDELIK
jgi:hypothetical protein